MSKRKDEIGDEASVSQAGAKLPHVLDYASAEANRRRLPFFRATLGIFACLGIVANLWFIYGSVSRLHSDTWAYHDLLQNPKAYGRVVRPEVIASLRHPPALWVSYLSFMLAATFGMLLAVHLLVAIVRLDRQPLDSARRLESYRIWKRSGAMMTAFFFFCAAWQDHSFWVAATRHHPVGSGPPIFSTVLLFMCAMLPRWWINKGADLTADLVDEQVDVGRGFLSRITLGAIVVAANYFVFGFGIFLDFFGGEIDRVGAMLCRATYWLSGPLVLVACLYSMLSRFVLPKHRWDLVGPSLAIIGYLTLTLMFIW